jgi:hypothetical protein
MEMEENQGFSLLMSRIRIVTSFARRYGQATRSSWPMEVNIPVSSSSEAPTMLLAPPDLRPRPTRWDEKAASRGDYNT